MVGYPLCKNADLAQKVNVDGAQNIVDLTPSHTRLVYASTGSNYGEVVGICTENTPLNPCRFMVEPKQRAEEIFLERDDTVSLRFATAFGCT